MSLQFTFEETSEDEGALAIPYPPRKSEGRINHGFIDLRGRPEDARKIAEAAPSLVFQDLLAQLASATSPYFTIGCELGGGWAETSPGSQSYVAGGYLQIASCDLNGPSALHLDQQKILARDLQTHLASVVGDYNWHVEFIVTVITATALGGPDQIWSPLIQMHAIAENPEKAGQSAEVLFKTIGDFIK